MKSLKVLLIENTNAQTDLLKQKLSHLDSLKLGVEHVTVKSAEETYRDCSGNFDVILFGMKVPVTALVGLTKIFRVTNNVVPIFILTRQSEARVPRKYRAAGVDDFFNIADLDTPLFAWSFMSAVEHAVLKKKAKEYDHLTNRLKHINESLATLMHDINNPLSVIRLAMYHLETPNLAPDKKETYLRLLVNNIERLDMEVQELRVIRRRLSGDAHHPVKILSLDPQAKISAAR